MIAFLTLSVFSSVQTEGFISRTFQSMPPQYSCQYCTVGRNTTHIKTSLKEIVLHLDDSYHRYAFQLLLVYCQPNCACCTNLQPNPTQLPYSSCSCIQLNIKTSVFSAPFCIGYDQHLHLTFGETAYTAVKDK
jgi:hypothetical protein